MIIVISNPAPVAGEHHIIHQLFEEGLDMFHVYKPHFSQEQTQNFLQQISARYRHKVALHAQHLKFHSLEELEACQQHYEYAFLSPVFDSISKTGYKSKFDLHSLKVFLRNRKGKIIALGGIDEDKISTLKDAGFFGIALLGAIWQSNEPVERFRQIKERWLTNELAY